MMPTAEEYQRGLERFFRKIFQLSLLLFLLMPCIALMLHYKHLFAGRPSAHVILEEHGTLKSTISGGRVIVVNIPRQRPYLYLATLQAHLYKIEATGLKVKGISSGNAPYEMIFYIDDPEPDSAGQSVTFASVKQ